MSNFIKTGVYIPTFTTAGDPALRIIEEDNGHSWTMNFMVNGKTIDIINMEHVLISMKVHESLLSLPVYNHYDNELLGTVESRLKEIIEAHLSLRESYEKWITKNFEN